LFPGITDEILYGFLNPDEDAAKAEEKLSSEQIY